MGIGPIADSVYTVVEFDTDDHCYMVHHLMEDHGMYFNEAVDYLELREGTHWWVKEQRKAGAN